jgi:monothiol glutaredoxin
MNPDLKNRIDQEVSSHKIVIYMKGTALFPQCGFSAMALEALKPYGDVYAVDVLADPAVREGIKQYTNWPTIPQVFINGKFVGGCDIVRELAERGELGDLVTGKES